MAENHSHSKFTALQNRTVSCHISCNAKHEKNDNNDNEAISEESSRVP